MYDVNFFLCTQYGRRSFCAYQEARFVERLLQVRPDSMSAPGKFDSGSLCGEGSKKKIGWIADHRLDDFIQGEEKLENFNRMFWRQQRREYKYHGTGVIEKVCTWFHCTFGPQDLRDKLPANGVLPDERLLEFGQVYLRSTTLTGYLPFSTFDFTYFWLGIASQCALLFAVNCSNSSRNFLFSVRALHPIVDIFLLCNASCLVVAFLYVALYTVVPLFSYAMHRDVAFSFCSMHVVVPYCWLGIPSARALFPSNSFQAPHTGVVVSVHLSQQCSPTDLVPFSSPRTSRITLIRT